MPLWWISKLWLLLRLRTLFHVYILYEQIPRYNWSKFSSLCFHFHRDSSNQWYQSNFVALLLKFFLFHIQVCKQLSILLLNTSFHVSSISMQSHIGTQKHFLASSPLWTHVSTMFVYILWDP